MILGKNKTVSLFVVNNGFHSHTQPVAEREDCVCNSTEFSGTQCGESCRVCTGQYFILFLFPVAMEHLHKSKQILIVLLMGTFYATKAAFVENLYRKLEPEQNITGQIGAEHKEISHIECSTM